MILCKELVCCNLLHSYRVHVLNPHGINWAIKHDPLAHRCGVSDSRSDEGGGQAILPFTGQRIVLPVQLTHGDTLGVQGVTQHRLEHLTVPILFMQIVHCTLQHDMTKKGGCCARGVAHSEHLCCHKYQVQLATPVLSVLQSSHLTASTENTTMAKHGCSGTGNK